MTSLSFLAEFLFLSGLSETRLFGDDVAVLLFHEAIEAAIVPVAHCVVLL